MKIITFLICDDIRYETGNKLSLMGVYDEVIEFPPAIAKSASWPKNMKLAFYIKLKIEESDEPPHSFILKMMDDAEENKLLEGNLNIKENIEENKKSIKVNLAIVHGNVKFNNAGDVIFVMDFFNDKKKMIETLNLSESIKVREKISSKE